MAREMVTETLKDWDASFDIPAEQFVAEINLLLDTLPPELRSQAMIEFDRYGSDYDSSYGELTLRYARPATDEELRQWTASDEAYRREAEARERAEFARLKRKFG